MFERRVDRPRGLPHGDVPALPGAQRPHERRAGEAAGRVVRLVQVDEILLRRVEQRVDLSYKQTVSSDFHALRFDGLWTSCPSPIGRPRGKTIDIWGHAQMTSALGGGEWVSQNLML